MHAFGDRRMRGRLGALLVAVQLVAVVLLPFAHVHDRSADVPHAEAPGTPHHSHTDTACHVCRVADTRYAAGTRATMSPAGALVAMGPAVAADAPDPRRRVLTQAAPRAPPLPNA
jgi:hypothetical protein